MTATKIDELKKRIQKASDSKDIVSQMEIASDIKCTMCGKTFSWLDLHLNNNLHDIYVGYGSKHDCERLQFCFCAKCFDKILDWIISQCKRDPYVYDDYMDYISGMKSNKENCELNHHKGSRVGVVVCGDDSFSDYQYLSKILTRYLTDSNRIEMVISQRSKIGLLSKEYADKNGFKCSVFLDEVDLIDGTLDSALEAQTLLIAFWDGENQETKEFIKKAFVGNIPCIISGYNGYDINTMIKKVWQKEEMYVPYVLGYYDSFYGLPKSRDINNEHWKSYYVRGYIDARKCLDYRDLLPCQNGKTISELIREDAQKIMIGEDPEFVWFELMPE